MCLWNPSHWRVLVLVVVVCQAAGWAAAARAEDWPQWGGHADRNMVSRERNLVVSFVPGARQSDGPGIDLKTTQNVKWVAPLGKQTYAGPTVAGGRVYIGTNDRSLRDQRYEPSGGGVLMCLDEMTGRLLWQLAVRALERTPKAKKYHNPLELGICSTPAVEGNRVYVVSNRGEVLCLDVSGLADGNSGPFTEEDHYTQGLDKPPVKLLPSDPDIVWEYDMLKDLPVFPHDANSSAVLIHGDVLYVGTANGVDNHETPFPLGPSLIALDKRSGRLAGWDDVQIGTRVFHGQWSSPSLGNVGGKPLVFFGGGDGVCYAFEALATVPKKPGPLKCVWSCDCNPPEYRFKDGQPIDYWNGDTRRSDANNNDGGFVGPSEIIATPVFYKNRVYVAIGQDPMHGRGRGMLTCIDATKTGDVSKTGKIWSYDRIDRTISTVSIADGLVFAADLPGRLHCLDAETGKCYWVYDTDEEIWGATLVADGKVYLGTKKGLWVFAAGKEQKVLSQTRLGTPVWCSPVAANGVLYVASQRYLWAAAPQAQIATQPDNPPPGAPVRTTVTSSP